MKRSVKKVLCVHGHLEAGSFNISDDSVLLNEKNEALVFLSSTEAWLSTSVLGVLRVLGLGVTWPAGKTGPVLELWSLATSLNIFVPQFPCL